MKLIRSALLSANAVLSRQSHVIRSFSANPFSVPDDWDKLNSSGPVGESEQKNYDPRLRLHEYGQWLDKAEKARNQSGLGSSFNAVPDDWDKLNSSGLVGESEQIPWFYSFYPKFDKAEKARDQSGLGSSFNRTLRESQRVEFTVDTRDDGRSKAVDVSIIATGAPEGVPPLPTHVSVPTSLFLKWISMAEERKKSAEIEMMYWAQVQRDLKTLLPGQKGGEDVHTEVPYTGGASTSGAAAGETNAGGAYEGGVSGSTRG